MTVDERDVKGQRESSSTFHPRLAGAIDSHNLRERNRQIYLRSLLSPAMASSYAFPAISYPLSANLIHKKWVNEPILSMIIHIKMYDQNSNQQFINHQKAKEREREKESSIRFKDRLNMHDSILSSRNG